ncbi:hypothetical protein POKO110462_17090 [Pontibacter korlensis]|uniref:Uncharacterized protein n=1 Tax=Pontibacter korlensis TaxID=400092 RepID=A0A0E3ZDN0_9BACT|nr:hypothetical protein [Pontibacter korlensis]AKD03309.1 hypothetical protein PKOR_09465 [Pontibacter korlensis]
MYIYLPQQVVDWVDRDFNRLKELVTEGGGKWSRTIEKRLRERTLFIIWYVITRRLFPAKGDNGERLREKSSLREFVSIHRDELARYGGSTHYYSIRKFLEQIFVLEVNEAYSTGQVPDYLHRYRREVLSRVSLSEEVEESLLASQGGYEELELRLSP